MLNQSVDLMIFARRPEVVDSYVGMGASTAASLADLARSCDVVMVCVFSDEQLLAVTQGPEGLVANMGAGSILVSHTTGSPETIRTISADAAPFGVHVLDGPVSGDQDDVPDGRLTVMLGGDDAAIERVRPILATYADNIVWVGPVGAAMAVKLVNNLLWAANLQVAQQAILLGEAMGAELPALQAAIPVSSGRSYAFDIAARFGSVERLDSLAGPYMRKDVDRVLEVVAAMGIDPGVLRSAALDGPLRFPARPT
jgi:3-hydroxyisobutyrate dehydrogenase-like beta-hydroxyacid dehydrogenase